MDRSNPSGLAKLFAALADPTRLRLLNLMNGREVCVCYFVEILKLPQPKISQHLAYLRKAGIVRARREGKWMHYSIAQPGGRAMASVLNSALEAVSADQEMQADIDALGRACCQPERFQLAGGPAGGNLAGGNLAGGNLAGGSLAGGRPAGRSC